MKTRRLLVGLILACLLIVTAASAAVYPRYYTGGNADGSIAASWAWMGNNKWIDQGCPEVGITYYYGYWSAAMVSMPISSLAGQTLAPGSAKLWFHTNGLNGITLNRFDSDTAGTIAWDYINSAQTNIATLTTGAGWQSIDVTPHLQAQINAGYGWAGFIFRTGNDTECKVTMSEGGNAAYLEIVPEPSSLLALLTGASGVAGLAIRRRK